MGMSMGNANLYYNVIDEVYCFMPKNDSRLKKEKGWKLWSIDDEPMDAEEEDTFEEDLRSQEEIENYMLGDWEIDGEPECHD